MRLTKKQLGFVLGSLVVLMSFWHSWRAEYGAPRVSARDWSDGVYEVAQVVDGDTIVVKNTDGEEKVRFIGINTPESVDPRRAVECFGHEASNEAKSLMEHQRVRLEADASQGDRDKYNRLLRYVFLTDGTNVNLELVKRGFAYEYTYDVPYRYQTEFKVAARVARTELRGLWAPTTCSGQKKLKK